MLYIANGPFPTTKGYFKLSPIGNCYRIEEIV